MINYILDHMLEMDLHHMIIQYQFFIEFFSILFHLLLISKIYLKEKFQTFLIIF